MEHMLLALCNGTKEEIHKTIKELEKVRYQKNNVRTKKFIRQLISVYPSINTPTNKSAIIKAIEVFTYELGFGMYDELKPLVLNALEDLNGNVRQSALHLAEWLVWALQSEFLHKKAILASKNAYEDKLFNFILALDALSEKHKGEAKEMIYINDLKSCPYKTIQKLINNLYFRETFKGLCKKYGYDIYPSDNDVFGEHSNIWQEVSNYDLELHEIEFARKLKKIDKSVDKKKITYYVFEITLEHDKKQIKRILQIVKTLPLYSFAHAIVDAYDFYFDHSFGFYDNYDTYESEQMYELFTDIDDVETTPGAKGVMKTSIQDVWKGTGDTMYFLFDYGDNWLFKVKLIDSLNTFSVRRRNVWSVLKEVGEAPEQYPDYN